MTLQGKVVLVTGASRGVGRGIALGLGEAGATVYVTGRTAAAVAEVAAEVKALGGVGIAAPCDHGDDAAVAGVFDAIERDQGRLDLLVNNAAEFPDQRFLFGDTPFWELSTDTWDMFFRIGLRSDFVAARFAAPIMLRQASGLIVNVSSAGAIAKFAIAPYGVAKAALDRLTQEMGGELKDRGVAVVSLWPPPTATESQLAAVADDDEPGTWSMPIFNGRVVAALVQSDGLAERSGRAFRVRELAAELGIADLLYQPN